MPWMIGALGALVVAAVVVWQFRSNATGVSSLNASIIERLTYDSGRTMMPALSPDGRLVAYASNRAGRSDYDIWVQQVAGGVPLRLTDDPADDVTPDFSPDGSQIAFRSERGGGGVYLVSALGGSARLIAPEGRQPRFSPDGTRIAYWSGQWRGEGPGRASAAFVISLAGGTPTALAPELFGAARTRYGLGTAGRC